MNEDKKNKNKIKVSELYLATYAITLWGHHSKPNYKFAIFFKTQTRTVYIIILFIIKCFHDLMLLSELTQKMNMNIFYHQVKLRCMVNLAIISDALEEVTKSSKIER